MIDLNLPDFSHENPPPPSGLTMDQYLEFVLMNLRLFGYPEEARQQILQELVEVPFRL